MDKEELKKKAKEYDVLFILGGLALGTVIVSGISAGAISHRLTAHRMTQLMKSLKPIQLKLELTPEFLAQVKAMPPAALNYNFLTPPGIG